jgi:transposase
MLPSVAKTYAPEGETPVVQGSESRDHVSSIGAITPEGRLLTGMQEESFDRHDIVDFLRHVLRHIEGKVLIIWDGLPAHRSQKVRDFLSETGERVHMEQLPGYAPDLNPDEGIWQYLKNVELKNVCCESLGALKKQLRLAFERLRHKIEVIEGCFGLAGLGLEGLDL